MTKRPIRRNVDLNLFVVFEAVYREGSLTKAGTLIGLSQPAVSHAISRLREILKDDLFIRKRGGVMPTVFSRSIIDDVSAGLLQIRGAISDEPQFDPANSSAIFNISMSFGFEAWIMPQLLKSLTKLSPAITVNSTHTPRRELENKLANGELDLGIDVAGPISQDILCERLRTDRRIVIARKGHPILKKKLTPSAYLAADHLVVSSRLRGGALEDYDLARRGEKRRIGARCGSLLAGIQIVSETDLLLTLGEIQLNHLMPQLNIAIRDYPFADDETEIMLFWHRSFDNDPRNIWLRNMLRQT